MLFSLIHRIISKKLLKITMIGVNMTFKIDNFDRKILTILQQDAGLTVSELATKIGLSTSPCWRRLKRLMDAGY